MYSRLKEGVGRCVVKQNDAFPLLRFSCVSFRSRVHKVGWLSKRLGPGNDAHLAVALKAEVVCNRVDARLQKHALVAFASCICFGETFECHRRHGFKIIFQRSDRNVLELRGAVELHRSAGYLNILSMLRVRLRLRIVHVDKDCIRCVPLIFGLSCPGGLNIEPVLPMFTVNGGDYAPGSHYLIFKRSSCAGALDLSDRGNLTRLRLLRLRCRICRIFRIGINGHLTSVTRVLRCRLSNDEVTRVVVGVNADLPALYRL